MFMFDEEQVTEKSSPRTVNELTDLHVDRVDLVERGAVRDPDHPSQPARFLIAKSEQRQLFSREPVTMGEPMSEDDYRRTNRALKAASLSGSRSPAMGEARVGRPSAGTAYERLQQLIDDAMTANGLEDQPKKTREQIVVEVTSKEPGRSLWNQIRNESDAPPTLKAENSLESAAEREVRRIAKREQEINPKLTDQQAIAAALNTTEGKKAYADFRRGQDEVIKAQAIESRDIQSIHKQEATRLLNRMIDHHMGTVHVGRPEAVSAVLKSEAGQQAYRVMVGAPPPQRESLPVSKSDPAYHRLFAIAEEIYKSGGAKSRAQAMTIAIRQNPEVHRDYMAGMRQDMDETRARA